MKNDVLIASQPISSIDVSRDFIVCGGLDESVFVWRHKAPFAVLAHNLMGVVDVRLDENETRVAASCLDGMIRIWDLEAAKCSEIKCDAFENWKVRFLDNYTLITAGESGIVSMYHTETRDRITTIETDKVYYATSLSVNVTSYDSSTICVGNEGGYLFVIANGKVQHKMKPHGRPIRDTCHLSQNKLLTASDDGLIRLIDLEKQCIESYFFGHKYGVNAIDNYDEQTFVTCAHDRTIRYWSTSQRSSTRVIQVGNDKPETINGVRYTKDGKAVVAAHQNGMVVFYT